jgi:potassium-dependent mechanosensitive channel
MAWTFLFPTATCSKRTLSTGRCPTLTAAVEAQPEVLKEPAAVVAFEAFGDNALTFHIYFWLDIGRSDAMKVGTEIRLRIDRLCREAGIEMAFPQQEIHLHTSQPISVRVEPGEKNAA